MQEEIWKDRLRIGEGEQKAGKGRRLDETTVQVKLGT